VIARVAVLAALLCAVTTACGSSGARDTSPVERCVQRMLDRAKQDTHGGESHAGEIADYARRTYCEPFARAGFVYDDGTLAIGAYLRLLAGSTCGRSGDGEPSRTVPCDTPGIGSDPLDCGLLHFVRRAEVQEYLTALSPSVACDDGTPVHKLGAS
jgi:hypothetical protein